jgi:hypothetical protein
MPPDPMAATSIQENHSLGRLGCARAFARHDQRPHILPGGCLLLHDLHGDRAAVDDRPGMEKVKHASSFVQRAIRRQRLQRDVWGKMPGVPSVACGGLLPSIAWKLATA